jgi:hypothetical protein
MVVSTMMVKIEVIKVVAEYEVAVEVIVYAIEDHEHGNPETDPGSTLTMTGVCCSEHQLVAILGVP